MATNNTTSLDERRRRVNALIAINQHILDARFLLSNEICENIDDTDYTRELWKVARQSKDSNTQLADLIEKLINNSPLDM